MRFLSWLRPTAPRVHRKRLPFPRLGVLALEDRITPDARDIAGLRFNAPGTFAGSSSNATISTAVEVGLVPAAGAAFVPLLSLPGGVAVTASPASAKINSTLSARGMTFTGNNLGFVFDQPNNKFSIAGDASFSAGGVTIGASFGSAIGTPGLVLQSGKLASVDLAVTTSFSYGSVSFNTQDLRLKLDTGTATSTRYAVSGKATAAVAGQSSPITLTTQFGASAAKPGLVVVNGALTDLTVGITGGFSVAGVTVAAKDLTFAFNPAAKSYSLFGSASAGFKNAAVDVGFEALLGTAASPGVSVVNGKLVSLNLGVTSNFDVAGVSVSTKALTFTLNVPTNTYTLAGSAGFAFTGAGAAKVDLDVAFGGGGSPGLTVVNGQLRDLDVQVNGGFSVAGLSARATNLRFTYNRLFNQYGLSGAVAVSTAPVPGGKRVLDNFAIQLGSAASPGLVVQNGQLQRLDFALNGTIDLGPLQIKPENLRVQFTRAASVLQFTGKLTASLGSKFNASGELKNGGLVINTTTGAVQLNGVKLTVFDTRIGPVTVREAFVEYKSNPGGGFDLSGAAIVDLPAGLTVGGSFLFTNGTLQKITLFVEKDPGIPLGDTGVFVRRVDATLNNLSTPSALQLSGSVTFTAGPSYKIGTKSVSLVQGTVGVSLDLAANTLRFDGTVSMVGDFIPLAKGSITFFFNPADPKLSSVVVFVEVNLYNGFLKGTLNLNVSLAQISFNARLAVRIPDIVIPEVRFPDVDFGLLGVARGGVVIPATNIGGQELASVEVGGVLNNANPSQSFLTFRATLLGVVDASVVLRFNGQLAVSGTAFLIPFGPNNYQIPALFTDTAAPPPPALVPVLAAPTVRILSADRVAGSPTNDLLVRYQMTTAQTDLRQVSVGFAINDSGFRFATTVLGNLQPGQTFDRATGIGTLIVRNPDAQATPGQPYRLRPVINDELFPSTSGAPLGPINPVFPPPVINAPATFTVPAVNQPRQLGGISVADPAAQFDASARLRVSLQSDSTIRLRLPPEVVAGSSVVVEVNDGREVILVGPTAEINTALGLVEITRRFDNDAHSLSVFVSRPGTGISALRRDVTLPANPPPVGLFIPPGNRTQVNNFNRSILPYLDATLNLEAGTRVRVIRVSLLRGPAPAGRDVNDFFDGPLTAVIPAGVTIDASYDRGSRQLILTAFQETETTADFQNVLRSVLYAPISRLGGTLTLRLTVGLTKNGRSLPEQVLDTRTLTVAEPNAFPLRSLSIASASLVAGAQLLVNARDAGAAFTGDGPRVVAPELTVTDTDAADPVATATVAFTGLYDATSDILAFTSVGGVVGGFDPATGVLDLKGGPATTLADFQAVLRGVTYTGTRKNPTPYPRELTVTVTTASGAVNSEPFLGRISLELDVPTVPPGVTGTTSPLAFAPNAAPLAVFPDFALTYPDAALPPPTVPLGTFIPGSTLTRGSVQIASGYVRGEDFLAFTPVGAITGSFDPASGELLLEGVGTLAEYQQAIRSVTYQNRNTSPSAADRTLVVTLDDGSASDNPPTFARVVQPQSDGLDTVRTSGSLTELVVTPFTATASLGLGDLNYAPRPGETELVYTILATPVLGRGTVRLTNGAVAEIGMEVPIEQLRGATFLASGTPRSGTVPFTFSISGRNPVTRALTGTPVVATVPIRTTNVAPTAGNDAFRIPRDTGASLALLDNDTDPNRDLLRVESVTQPAHGVAALAADGSVRYTPAAGFSGTDSFRYTVIDGAGGSATATATVTVVAPAVPPVAPPVVPPVVPVAPPPPSAGLIGFREFAAGSDFGDAGTATLYSPAGVAAFTVNPFGAGFTGGVRTAAADFNGDGVADLVVGTGPGRATQVLVLDGKTQAVLFTIDPFETAFTGGVFVAAGDLSGDGVPDLVVTPDEGGGPRVRVFSGNGFGQLADFYGIDDPNFRGGARASVADLTGDGVGDLIVSAGFGGGPRVAVFDGKSLADGALTVKPFGDFFAFEPGLRNGAFVTGGDLNGDGFAELIAGGGPGGGPRVTAFDGRSLLGNAQTVVANFFAGDTDSRGGVRVAVKNLDGDDRADLVVGAGAGAGSRVTAFLGKSVTPDGAPPEALAFDALPGSRGGVFVG